MIAFLRYGCGMPLHRDDTTMKVLSFLNFNDNESTRKGIFTSGIVSVKEHHRIACLSPDTIMPERI